MELEKGQQVLINDLIELLSEVKAGEFGDFASQKYTMPKMAIITRFEEFVKNVKNGKYD